MSDNLPSLMLVFMISANGVAKFSAALLINLAGTSRTETLCPFESCGILSLAIFWVFLRLVFGLADILSLSISLSLQLVNILKLQRLSGSLIFWVLSSASLVNYVLHLNRRSRRRAGVGAEGGAGGEAGEGGDE